MDLYPWRFDSIHSHCHDDVISIFNILKEFWAIARYRAPLQRIQKKSESAGTSPLQLLSECIEFHPQPQSHRHLQTQLGKEADSLR
jgi:hypothetical protein